MHLANVKELPGVGTAKVCPSNNERSVSCCKEGGADADEGKGCCSMTTPAERRTFPFQPTNRERPPSRSTHTSEEYVHIDLDGDASKFNYTPPFSSGIPTTPSKAKLKNYVFPPTTSETIDRLDYPAYGLEHPTDDLDGAMGSGRRPRGESDLGRPALRSRAPSITYGLAAIPSEYELDTPLIHKAPPNFE